MSAAWDHFGDIANVAQLTRLDAVKLIGMIVQAASTARMHKKNCKQFATHLKLIGNLLQQLKISELKRYPETREPLEHLEDALRRSYILVNSCQDRSYLYLLAMGWNIVYQFRKAQNEIDNYLKIIPHITLVDNARVRERLEYIEMDQREYTLDDEDRKVQTVIMNPDPSHTDTAVLKKTLSCSYPSLPFKEVIKKEKEKLNVELQRSQSNYDVGQCEVIQHLLEVTEVVASKSQHEQDSPKKISKKMEAQYSNVRSNNDAEDEKPHSTSRVSTNYVVVYYNIIRSHICRDVVCFREKIKKPRMLYCQKGCLVSMILLQQGAFGAATVGEFKYSNGSQSSTFGNSSRGVSGQEVAGHYTLHENNIHACSTTRESPEEVTFLIAAQEFGFQFYKRTQSSMFVKEIDRSTVEFKREYKLLNLLEFSSSRKRMSVIVHDEAGQIFLFCKGADNFIFDRLVDGGRTYQHARTMHLANYAADGLRTMVFAYRKVKDSKYEEWISSFAKAKSIIGRKREEMLENVSETIDTLFSSFFFKSNGRGWEGKSKKGRS